MASESQRIAMAILPKITGLPSSIFSLVIVIVVLRSKRRRGQTFHRLMAALSLIDCITSFGGVLSTWPVPKIYGEYGVMYAAGTVTTCNIAAFFNNMAGASILYNLSLSFYYLLVIRFGWKDKKIRSIEPLMHAIPLAWAIGSGLVALFLDAYTFAALWCWISDDNDILRWTNIYGPLYVCYVVIVVNCYLTYSQVHNIELKVSKYRFQPSTEPAADQISSVGETTTVTSTKVRFDANTQKKKNERAFKRSRKLARQCILYTGAFYLTWSPISILRFLQLFDILPMPLVLIAALCTPMQGLPNVLIYLLPEVKKLRKRNPHHGWIRSFLVALFHKTTGGGDNSSSLNTSVVRKSSFGSNVEHGDGNDVEEEKYVDENPPIDDDENDDDDDHESLDDDDDHDHESLDGINQGSERSNSGSGFMKMWMDRRCRNGWDKKTETVNDDNNSTNHNMSTTATTTKSSSMEPTTTTTDSIVVGDGVGLDTESGTSASKSSSMEFTTTET